MPFNQPNQQRALQSRSYANNENSNAYYSQENYFSANGIPILINASQLGQSKCIPLRGSCEPSCPHVRVNNYSGVHNLANHNLQNSFMNVQNYNNSVLIVDKNQYVVNCDNVVQPQYIYIQNNANPIPFVNETSNTIPQIPAVGDHTPFWNQNMSEPQNLYPVESALDNSTDYMAENIQYSQNLNSNMYVQQQPQAVTNVGMVNNFIYSNNSSPQPVQVIPNQWGMNALQNVFPNTLQNANNNAVPVDVNNEVYPQGCNGKLNNGSYKYLAVNQDPKNQNYIHLCVDSTANMEFFIFNDNYFIQVIKDGKTYIVHVPQDYYNTLYMAYLKAIAPSQPPLSPSNSQNLVRQTNRTNNRRNNQQSSSIVQVNEEIVDLMDDPNNWEKLPNNAGYMCKICNKGFTRRYGLKIHLRTHSGHKPLQCKVCDKTFSDPSNMAKHARLHDNNNAKYACPICNARHSRKRDYDRHINTRHPRIDPPEI